MPGSYKHKVGSAGRKYLLAGLGVSLILFFVSTVVEAETFPAHAKTITGYLNGNCYVNSDDDTAPQNNNGECFHALNDAFTEINVPDNVLPNMPITILATKIWFIQNGGVVATTGYSAISCGAQATTFLNFIDAVINYHVSDTALVQYVCPTGQYLWIQNTEPDDGALMQYEITYVDGVIASSSVPVYQLNALIGMNVGLAVLVSMLSMLGMGYWFSSFRKR